MTNDIMMSSVNSNYAPANYRSADVFGGNYPINTPAGKDFILLSCVTLIWVANGLIYFLISL